MRHFDAEGMDTIQPDQIQPDYDPRADGGPLLLGFFAAMLEQYEDMLTGALTKFEFLGPHYSAKTGQVDSISIRLSTGTYRVTAVRETDG